MPKNRQKQVQKVQTRKCPKIVEKEKNFKKQNKQAKMSGIVEMKKKIKIKTGRNRARKC